MSEIGGKRAAALAALRDGRLEEAEAAYEAVLADAPDDTEALFHLAAVRLGRDRPEAALAAIDRAIVLDPEDPRFRNGRGQSLARLKRYDEAEREFEAALLRNPADPDAYANLGAVLFEAGRYEEAELTLRKALIHHPRQLGAALNLGRTLLRLDRIEEAVALFQAVLQVSPASASALVNLGIGATLLGDYAGAREALERALRIEPGNVEGHVNYAHLLLLQGEFAAGFAAHEWRLKRPGYRDLDAFAAPMWRGEDLAGQTVLLWGEQGIGDTLQFVRYAPLVAARGARVVVECHPSLHRLLRGVAGVAEVVPIRAATGYDLHAPLMSLPLRFGLGAVPDTVPYLPVPPAFDLGPSMGLRVGLVWAGNPEHARDLERSRRLAEFAPLAAARPDATFYALQKGPAAAEPRPAGMAVVDLGGRLGDFTDTAAAMAALDLVISVDSAPAHLAGALGVPVWTILPRVPDWRWELGRPDSTRWYPTMRLFREESGWDEVFERVAAALAGFRAATRDATIAG